MKRWICFLVALLLLGLCACELPQGSFVTTEQASGQTQTAQGEQGEEEFSLPEYDGSYYAVVGDNVPVFETLTQTAYETYPPLDALGRCQTVHACVGRELMPTEDRGSIGMVKPSGWQTAKYDFVDGKYLYNRCHLIGFQLTGENANERNLITGTRSMNVKGMLPFENLVADYVKDSHNHVMFRVTPVFVGEELVARGVRMEAFSVEDEGEGVCFDVFVFNAEPGVEIDYATGENRQAKASPTQGTQTEVTCVLNVSSKKIHEPHCHLVKTIKEENRKDYRGAVSELLSQGYSYCGTCH